MPYKDKEKQREYHRKYIQERIKTDPEYIKKRNKTQREADRKSRLNDPEFLRRKAERQRRYYQKNKNDLKFKAKQKIHTERQHKTYMLSVQDIIDTFRNNGCRKCGVRDIECLCAHHKNPKLKKFNIARIRVIKPTRGELRKELKKCVSLCLNCHAKLHAEQRREKKKEIKNDKKL